MLHYFAKKFFHATILSAYIERDNVSLYYINDNVVQHTREFHGQHRDFDSKQYHDIEMRQSGSRLNDALLNLSQFTSVFESQLNHLTYAAEDWLNNWNEVSLTHSDNVDDGEGIDDMTVNVKHKNNDLSELHLTQRNCIVSLLCFHWNSFEPSAEWNVTFHQV